LLRATILSSHPNRLKNTIELLMNLVVPEPDDGDVFPGQEVFSYLIAFLPKRIAMAGTIQFDGEFQSRTIEIQDVRIDWMLPSEFVTGEIPISQVTPEDTLAIRCILAEITGATHGGVFDEIAIS